MVSSWPSAVSYQLSAVGASRSADNARTGRLDSRHVGLRLAADALYDGGRHRACYAVRDVVAPAEREHRGTGAREAAPERARRHRRALDRLEAGHERRALRFADAVLERTPEQREIGSVERVDEGPEVRPLLDRVRELDGIAEQGARLRRLDLEVGVD